MGLASVLIPPSLDAKQALRLRRFGLGVLTYALTAVLVALAWSFGAMQASAALQVVAIYLAVNLALYAAIRSGFNLRFADPSLTLFQVLAAITQVMFIVYHMEEGREIALSGCFIVLLFGLFRLSAREFAGISLYTLGAYGLVILLLMHGRPHAIRDVHLAWMSWLLLAGFLPIYAVIGGRIVALRGRLRESEARFRGLTEMSSDLYWETDATHRISERSSSDGRLQDGSVFRHRLEIGQRRWEVPSLSPDEAGWRAHREVLDARRPFRDFVLSRLASDGTERYLSISGDPKFDAGGTFLGYRGVGTDVTARKRTEREARESAEELRLFADNIPAMTVAWDENLRYRFVSKVYSEFYGVAIDEILGKYVNEFLGDKAYGEIKGYLDQALQGHAVTYGRTHVKSDGVAHFLEVRLLPYVGENGKVQACFGLITDITEQTLAQERTQHLAHHDSLTGLPNRLLFDDRLNQAVYQAKRDSRPFALLYLDLDRFKPVNDTLGHAAGDELLKGVAGRIRRQVRESDTVARVGGDEFTVILSGISRREEAQTVARKIVAALGAPFELAGRTQSVDIGISIGIAIYPTDGTSSGALLKAADAAMYAEKQAAAPDLPHAA